MNRTRHDEQPTPGRARVWKYLPLVVVAALTVTTAPAEAAPAKIGPVQGLALTISKSADGYVVASDWNDLTGATAYRVSLASGGTVLRSDRVTVSAWTATTTLGAGAPVTLKVVPLAGSRPGRAASLNDVLPDLTAPSGTFQVVQATPGSRTVTILQLALSDDVTPTGSIVRTINWGDGTPAQPWTVPTHIYAVDMASYQPTVTVADAAGNRQEVPLGPVVVGDQTAPTGAFAATSSGWAGWTRIALAPTVEVADNFSAREKVTRTVAWGDGSTDTWTDGATPTHVYTAPGTFSPTVTLVDEAGNTGAATVLNTVLVTADTARPTVSLTKPATRRTWVRKWVTLRGKVSDAATGVSAARLRLVEKRGTAWYAYRGSTRRWVRGGTTQAAAMRRATLVTVRPTAQNTWSYKVSGLRKGHLVLRLQAVDNVANVSALTTVRQTLTHN